MKQVINNTFRVCRIGFFLLSVGSYSSIVAAQNVEELVSNCFACHGKDGISENELWPNLAGQQTQYLANQIIAFRDKTRDEPEMWSQVKDLTDAQIQSIAEYYSAKPYPKPTLEDEDKINMAGMNVRAYCVSCHGLSGNTIVSSWPNLAGQQRAYTEQQLLAYKSGKRIHPLMNVIANELTDKQIADVAEYFSQVGFE